MNATAFRTPRSFCRTGLAAAAALLLALPARAQVSSAIALRVTDAETGGPLPGASVRLDGALAGVSDARGYLRISPVPSGTHQMEVVMLGRRLATPEVDVAPGGVLDLEVALEPSVLVLPGVDVIARARRPRSDGAETDDWALALDRAALLAALEMHSQAVAELSTPRPDPAIPQVRGRVLADPKGEASDGGGDDVCIPDLFVDGVRVEYNGPVYLGDLAQPEPDPFDGPPEFGAIASECGAILIWTTTR